LDDTSEFGSGRNPNRFNNNYGQNGKGNLNMFQPNLVVLCPEEEVLCGDGCHKPAILFGKKI
jgi:hypothetical protein